MQSVLEHDLWFPDTYVQAPIHWATQPAITYSNLTIETLEQGVKYVQS